VGLQRFRSSRLTGPQHIETDLATTVVSHPPRFSIPSASEQGALNIPIDNFYDTEVKVIIRNITKYCSHSENTGPALLSFVSAGFVRG
jgi:hypothetical protein